MFTMVSYSLLLLQTPPKTSSSSSSSPSSPPSSFSSWWGGRVASFMMAYSGELAPVCRERRSWFMKWLCRLFKGPGANTGGGRATVLTDNNDNGNKGDHRRSGRDNTEDLDRAIALSLADAAKNPNGKKSESDEEFAKALQESLKIPAPPAAYDPPTAVPCLPRGYKFCGGCKREIGHGHYLSCMGSFWHPQCFRCHFCGRQIRETEFSLSGSNPYHKLCYKQLHHPKCDVCHEFIPTNRVGLIEYRAHPFWGQKYCPSHEHDRTPRCCSCERMESRSTRYISLGDGRCLCLECLDSAVMDTGDCQPLYHAIRDYYEGMNMKIDQQIPMLMVERQALNEAMEGEKDGHHHMPETRGLCLSEEQTVSSIFKRPRIGENRIVDMKTYPQKLTRRCEVTAILILYGLPRLLTGSILAHELMHGWLRLKGYRNLSPEVEEGICQVLSQMWLESEIVPVSRKNMPSTSTCASSSSSSSTSSASSTSTSKKGKTSEMERKLGEFFMHQIAHDTSPAYGGGFRAANAAVNKYGLRATLDHIRLTGHFPL
ncbi:DA1-related protein 2 [Zostera marina]|uniref:DA1-related protein 2 n=1 Tax=Zostera marina TaxID=29655 RepID=A0A0K9PMN0_ZOSMR|nr:DA1-related protein 2 [Zostera marina]